MSIKIMSKVFELEGMKSGQKLLLIALANYCNDDGENVYPSLATLSRMSCLSRRAVITNMRDLENMKLIIPVGTRKTGVIIYSINVSVLDELLVKGSAETAPPPVQKLHPPSAETAPDPLIDPLLNPFKKERDLNPLYEFAAVMADLCKIDINISSNKVRLMRRSKELMAAGYTEDNLNRFKNWWYLRDWRGKQGQPPTPEIVQKEIMKSIPVIPGRSLEMTMQEIADAIAEK